MIELTLSFSMAIFFPGRNPFSDHAEDLEGVEPTAIAPVWLTCFSRLGNNDKKVPCKMWQPTAIQAKTNDKCIAGHPLPLKKNRSRRKLTLP